VHGDLYILYPDNNARRARSMVVLHIYCTIHNTEHATMDINPTQINIDNKVSWTALLSIQFCGHRLCEFTTKALLEPGRNDLTRFWITTTRPRRRIRLWMVVRRLVINNKWWCPPKLVLLKIGMGLFDVGINNFVCGASLPFSSEDKWGKRVEVN
jgi:hypothetical protein